MRVPLPLDPPLRESLRRQRDAILQDWRDRVMASYPEEALRLLRRSPDPFSNPVVHRLHEGTAAIVDLLLAPEVSAAALAKALDPLMRVRAVQAQPASEAVGSMLLLKRALAGVASTRTPEERAALDDAVDALMVAGFDAYMRCRDELHEIRLRDVRRRVAVVLERYAGPPADDDAAEAASAPLGR